MLFIGLKDYFYIGIIITILVYFLIIKKNENFTTQAPIDITISESIKNLGIIAKEMIDDKYITIYGTEKIRIPNLDSLDNIINFVEEQN
jgi:hypothetical protein